jgi:hypothetical protein
VLAMRLLNAPQEVADMAPIKCCKLYPSGVMVCPFE